MGKGGVGSGNGNDGKMKKEWSEKSRVFNSSSILCVGFFLFYDLESM